MQYFRIYESLPGRTPFGYGVAGGRQNARGVPMIYDERYRALNLSEMLCIRGSAVSSVRRSFAIFELDADSLPPDRNPVPYPDSTVGIGSEWRNEQSGPFLKVPSAHFPLNRFPDEHNLLINPLHPSVYTSLRVREAGEAGFLLNY